MRRRKDHAAKVHPAKEEMVAAVEGWAARRPEWCSAGGVAAVLRRHPAPAIFGCGLLLFMAVEYTIPMVRPDSPPLDRMPAPRLPVREIRGARACIGRQVRERQCSRASRAPSTAGGGAPPLHEPPDDDDDDGHAIAGGGAESATTPGGMQTVKSLTAQIKDIALKASGAYRHCKPCASASSPAASRRQQPYYYAESGSDRFRYAYQRAGSSAASTPRLRTRGAMSISSGDVTPSVSAHTDFLAGDEGDDEEETAAGSSEEDEAKEWVAQVEPGVLITFLSLPCGGNGLKRIRFR